MGLEDHCMGAIADIGSKATVWHMPLAYAANCYAIDSYLRITYAGYMPFLFTSANDAQWKDAA
jgi:hypothetical protein